jgi:tellurite resistance protein TehA-like permease
MTPVWIFPIYPLLIIGPHAAVLSKSLRQSRALEVIVGGITLQGTGFMVSIMIYSAFIYRLMTQKLPQEPLRPGMFVSVGPAGFTITALINIGENLDRSFPPDFMGDGHMAAFILRVVANWWGVWLWGLACWFFLASVGAHFSAAKHGTMRFAMAWFSFVFPQTALITATLAVGKAFGSHVIQVVGTVMAGILVSVWIFVVVMMIRAIHFKYILWPQLGEDKDEGGFKRGSI